MSVNKDDFISIQYSVLCVMHTSCFLEFTVTTSPLRAWSRAIMVFTGAIFDFRARHLKEGCYMKLGGKKAGPVFYRLAC